MPERLPIYINPERAVARGLEASGSFKLEKMDRLRDRLLSPYGEVNVALQFGAEGKRKYLKGHIVGEMILECQRCMSDMKMVVDHSFRLGFIQSEAEIDALLPGEEPLMVNNEDLFIADIIEDELELLLPMVVMHDPGSCEANVLSTIEEEPEEEPVIEDKRPNPFAVLVDLKK